MSSNHLCTICFLLTSFSAFAKDVISTCDNRESSVEVCLQREIIRSSKLRQQLVLRRVNYTLNNPLYLSSNASINGNGAVLNLKFSKPNQAAFYGESLNNIKIMNLKIDGNGEYSESAFINPYYQPGKPLAIGFSNTNNGIALAGKCSNIIIDNVTMLNLHHGIYIDAISHNDYSSRIESVTILNSKFDDIGKAGIFLRNVSNAKIYKNKISNVNGNFISGVAPDLKLTAWADGIYVRGLQNSKIESNTISSIRRIGIVLEGEWNSKTSKPLTTNSNLVIADNIINNVFGSKGTEENGGIWIEGYTTVKGVNIIKSSNVIINNNILTNYNAISGNHNQYGIISGGTSVLINGNTVRGFNNINSYGIVCSFKCILENNNLQNNYYNYGKFNIKSQKVVMSKFKRNILGEDDVE